MAGFARDLRYAVRTLARMRAVAVLAIATLALGIGATTTMFSVVHAMLLRPPPFADPDRLVVLFNTRTSARDGQQRLRWSLSNITALEQATTSFDSIGSFSGPLLTISGRGEPAHVDGETVTTRILQGAAGAADRGPPVRRRRGHRRRRPAGRVDRRGALEANPRKRSHRRSAAR